MSVANAMGSALYSKLTGGTALVALLANGTAIYRTQAPDQSPLPYVVFSVYSGGPLNITGSDMREEVYFVRGYASLPAVAGSIDLQISALLHKGTVSVSGYNNYLSVREMDLELVENPPNGEKVFMSGGLYRISLDD